MGSRQHQPAGVSGYGVLGPLCVTKDGRDVTPSSAMQRRILAALLADPGRVVTVDRLQDLLWRDEPPPTWRKTLHALISRLRRRLGSAQIETRGDGYALTARSDRIDAYRFESLVDRAATTADTATRLAHLDEALALWRGAALGELSDDEIGAAEGRRLEELRLKAMEDRTDAMLQAGQADAATADLEAFVARHPFRERPHAQLMVAHYRSHRIKEALDVYRTFRTRLVEELGLEPTADLQNLELRILQQDPTLQNAGTAGGEGLRGRSLPAPPNELIGRATDLETLREAVDNARLVTLVGPPGVGKTRLALGFAQSMTPSEVDDVRWCELGSVDSWSHAGDWVMELLGLRRGSDTGVIDQVVDALSGRDMLVVFDNCEHVIDEITELATALLHRTPSVTMLCTSRKPLGIAGEHLFPLAPLAVNSPTEGDPSPALELFLERARAVRPGFDLVDPAERALVEDICRRVDGLPLALELIAADLRAFGVVELAERVPDTLLAASSQGRRGRPNALETAIDLSYQALTADERDMFNRLAVFLGGFDLEAAAAVAEADADLIALVRTLVDRSLVTPDHSGPHTRYHMLETLRAFGLRRLESTGRAVMTRDDHALWAVDLVERMAGDLVTDAEVAAVRRLDAELPNLRAALAHCVATGKADLALRLCASLHIYAFPRHRDEVFAWTESALAMKGAAEQPQYPVALASLSLGQTTRWDLDAAEANARRAVEMSSDDLAVFTALDALSVVDYEGGALNPAIRNAEEAGEVAAAMGDGFRLALTYVTRAASYRALGDPDTAARHRARLDEIAAELRNPTIRAWSLIAEGEALRRDDPQQALDALRESVIVAQTVGNDLIVGLALRETADILADVGDATTSIAAFREIIDHWDARGDWAHQLTTMRCLVRLLARLGEFRAGAELLGAVRAGYRRTAAVGDLPFGPIGRRLAQAEKAFGQALGGSALQEALGRGGAMSRHEAVRAALEALDAVDPEPPAIRLDARVRSR